MRHNTALICTTIISFLCLLSIIELPTVVRARMSRGKKNHGIGMWKRAFKKRYTVDGIKENIRKVCWKYYKKKMELKEGKFQ